MCNACTSVLSILSIKCTSSHQQHVAPDDEQLFAPLSEPLPLPQVTTEAGLRGGS